VVSGLPGLTAIWRALGDGIDGQPPLFYLMERSVALLIPGEELGYRLLSVLAFACTLALLYVFVAKRNGPFPALVSAAVLLTTQLFTYYAAEARPYSLLTACVALGLVCYQRATSPVWLLGLFVSLLLACSVHFYGVLELLPFFLAEMTIVYLTRKIRFAVWLVLLLPLLSLAPYVPLLLGMKQHWGAHFWNQSYLGPGYSAFFGAGTAWGTAFAGAGVVAMLATFLRSPNGVHAKESTAESTAERALILSLILVPMVGYAAGKVIHVAFVNRYVVPGILGVAAAGGYVLSRTKPLSLGLAASLVLFAIGVQEKEFWTSRQRMNVALKLTNLAETAHHEDLPIVVSPVTTYLEIWHYASPKLRQRTTAFSDPAHAILYLGSDTADIIAASLRYYVPVAVQDFAVFAVEHRTFLLYSPGTQSDWWPKRLVHDGHRLQLLVVHGEDKIYLVELNPLTHD